MVPVLKNDKEKYMAKSYHLFLLFVVSKVSEKLVDNRCFDQFKKYGLLSFSSVFSGLLDQQQIF